MPIPDNILFQRRSNQLVLQYGEQTFELGAEFLRVHSPSAEVRGHGPGQSILQHGKQGVRLEGIEAQGNYALRLIFSDGHDSGLFTWDYLYQLCTQFESLWQTYLDELHRAGKFRDPAVRAVKFITPDIN